LGCTGRRSPRRISSGGGTKNYVCSPGKGEVSADRRGNPRSRTGTDGIRADRSRYDTHHDGRTPSLRLPDLSRSGKRPGRHHQPETGDALSVGPGRRSIHRHYAGRGVVPPNIPRRCF